MKSCIMRKLFLAVILLMLAGCAVRSVDRGADTTTVETPSAFVEDNTVDNFTYYHIMEADSADNLLSEQILLEKEDVIKQMKAFHEKLKQEFTYCEISFQPLQQLEFYDKDPKFIREGSRINEKVNIEGIETYVNTFCTVIVDDYFSRQLNGCIAKGRIFGEEDFQYQGGDIPIILGDSYQQYYDIGDLIRYNYLSEDFDFKVIGFWKKDTSIQGGAEKIYLNEYICLPYFDVSAMDITNTSSRFQEIYYRDRNTGYILADDDRDDIKSRVEALAGSCHLDYTITEGTSSVRINAD